MPQLMMFRYRARENVNLPFKVRPMINENGKRRVEYDVLVRATFPNSMRASDVVMRIPTPHNAANVSVRASYGKAKYLPEENIIIWK
jgi:AP-2 complex subunit mu-1